jgi:broad specificity phosphatase PhoE
MRGTHDPGEAPVQELWLVRHGPTSATERGAFGADEPLSDAAGTALAEPLPESAAIICSPARRCRQTAAALGLDPAIEPALRECEFGAWEGKTFAELSRGEVDAWLADPAYDGHGGESLQAFCRRIGAWLRSLTDPMTIAVTHGGVIRAAILLARGAPLSEFWQLERPSPLAIVRLEL